MRLLLFGAAIFWALCSPAQFAFIKNNNGTQALHDLIASTALVINNYSIVVDTPRINDKDGDGVPDSLDKCPDEKGVKQYDGCPLPDTDNDGIADDADSCPTVAGAVKNKGCPPGDRDGDKINDDDDRCPDTPGVARYEGCPVSDGDNDGVNDDNDKCKTVPGSPNNFGCPETKESRKAAKKEKRKHSEEN